jgi:hypothetical protein
MFFFLVPVATTLVEMAVAAAVTTVVTCVVSDAYDSFTGPSDKGDDNTEDRE